MHSSFVARSLLLCASAGALLAFIGCAVGTDPDVGVAELDNTAVEAGQGDDANTSVLPPSTHQDAGGDDAAADAGADTDAGGTTIDSGTGTDAGGGDVTSCSSPNVCSSATDLGSVRGDTGADVKTATGSGSQWFKIRVTEDDSGVFGYSMYTRVELASPSGTNFDLFVYLPGDGSSQECSTVKASSTNASGADAASIDWGESGAFSNGDDDGRTVTVEVRWVSGTCSPSSQWTLTVRGDT
jgi:hypothetical protein